MRSASVPQFLATVPPILRQSAGNSAAVPATLPSDSKSDRADFPSVADWQFLNGSSAWLYTSCARTLSVEIPDYSIGDTGIVTTPSRLNAIETTDTARTALTVMLPLKSLC